MAIICNQKPYIHLGDMQSKSHRYPHPSHTNYFGTTQNKEYGHTYTTGTQAVLPRSHEDPTLQHSITLVTQTQLDIHPGDRRSQLHTLKHPTTPGNTTKPQRLIQNLDLQAATACTKRPKALDTPRPRPGLPDPSPSASPWSRPGPCGANDLARTSRRKVGPL